MNLVHIVLMLGGALLGGAIGFLLASLLKVKNKGQKESIKTILICVLAFGGAFVVPTFFATPKGTEVRLNNALLEALGRKDPIIQQEINGQLNAEQTTKNRMNEYTITKGVSYALSYVPYGSDQSLLDLVEGLAVTTKTLLSKDAKACYSWLYGFYGHEDFDYPSFAEALGDNLLDYQFDLYARMVDSAGEEKIVYDSETARASVSHVSFQFLQSAGYQKSGLLTGQSAPTGLRDYEIACQARYVLYQALLREENAADAIRELFIQGG